jgi:tetratricopeptide (TPR) repeat protein
VEGRSRSSAARRAAIVPVALVAVLAVGAHAGSLGHGLPLDAGALVLGNPALRAFDWANLRTIAGSDYWSPMATNGLYRPVTTLSFLVNWTLLGNADRPFGYHLVNLLLHLACSLAVLALFRRLGFAAAAATIAAALFAVHPVTTEVVANVAGRADLLAALGVLLGVLSRARAATTAGSARIGWEAALVGSSVLAVFSKESGVVLLPLVIAWDALLGPPSAARDRLRGPLVTGAVVAVMLAARWWVRATGYPPEASPLDNPILEAGFWSGRATALAVLAQQAALLAWPATLRADYSYDQIPLVGWPPAPMALMEAALGAALLVALAVAAWRTRRRHPALCFLLLWIGLTVLPTSNLPMVIGSIRADRFLYLPLVGATGALTVVAWGQGSVQRRRIVCVLGAVAVVVCAVRSMVRNADWRDDLTLWRATVAVSPRNAKAHRAYGAELAARGEPGDRTRAIAEAAAATAIRPDYLQAWVDLGGYHLLDGVQASEHGDEAAARGAYRRALDAFRTAVPLDHAAARRFRRAMRAWGRAADTIPDYGNTALYQRLLLTRARLGHWHGVLASARTLQRLDPWHPGPHVDASAALVKLGRLDDAAVSLHQALLLGGEDAGSRLASVYHLLGDAAGGAVVRQGDGLALAGNHPLVRRHRCRGLEQLSRLFADAALPDQAVRFAAMARDACGIRAADGPA